MRFQPPERGVNPFVERCHINFECTLVYLASQKKAKTCEPLRMLANIREHKGEARVRFPLGSPTKSRVCSCRTKFFLPVAKKVAESRKKSSDFLTLFLCQLSLKNLTTADMNTTLHKRQSLTKKRLRTTNHCTNFARPECQIPRVRTNRTLAHGKGISHGD